MRIADVARAIFETLSVSSSLIQKSENAKHGSDDLTVEVIFFGNSDKSGDVVINKEASASAKEIKAKL